MPGYARLVIAAFRRLETRSLYSPADARRRKPSCRKQSALSPYFEQYLTVAAFAALGVVLVVGILGVSSLVRPSNPTVNKLLTYECGIDPVGSGWSQTYVRYYIFGLLFVIFDVEAVFIFPWAVRLEELGMFGLVEMLVFLAILILGLLYAVRKGVLRWE